MIKKISDKDKKDWQEFIDNNPNKSIVSGSIASIDDKGLTINLGTGTSHSVLDIIEMTKRISNKEISYDFVSRRDGDPDQLFSSSSVASDLLEWEPEHSDLETIIKDTWRVYSKNNSNC